MSHKFKIGDVVRCAPKNPVDTYCKKKIGKIIFIEKGDKYYFFPPYLIQFFEPIKHGHSGNRKGKDGYCRWFEDFELKLYKKSILKIFLKDKKESL